MLTLILALAIGAQVPPVGTEVNANEVWNEQASELVCPVDVGPLAVSDPVGTRRAEAAIQWCCMYPTACAHGEDCEPPGVPMPCPCLSQ